MLEVLPRSEVKLRLGAVPVERSSSEDVVKRAAKVTFADDTKEDVPAGVPATDDSDDSTLASEAVARLPSKFRRRHFLKRGSFVVAELAAEYAKVDFVVTRVLAESEVKQLRRNTSLW